METLFTVFTTEAVSYAWPDEDFQDFEYDQLEIPDTAEKSYLLKFEEIPLLDELIMLAVIVCVGLVFNSIILFLYFKEKCDLSRYIRVFAIYDLFVLVATCIDRASDLVETLHVIGILMDLIILITVAASLFGPLFLALDRFLAVWFPHSFHLYEKKMRIFKIILVLILITQKIAVFVIPRPPIAVYAFGSVYFVVQFVVCLVLYAVITVKIWKSDRKMREHRHVGNRCVMNEKIPYTRYN